MEVASPAGAERNTSLDEISLPDSPPPQHHQRRHIRYASPNASSIPSPHVLIDNHHPTHYRSPTPQAIMNSSQELPAIASSSHTPALSVQSESDRPAPDGQNHDRMETDEDSDDSGSHSGTDTPEQSEATTEPAPHPPAPEAEAMDTTPDHSPAPEVQPPPPVPNGDVDHTNATTVRMSVTANIGTNTSGLATLLDSPSLSFNMNGVNQPTGEVRVQVSNAALDAARAGRQLVARDESVDSRTRREPRAEDREREDEEDRDDESDDSSDEEDHPYWAKFKEDTSVPDEVELKIIEQSSLDEISGTDHEHWEKTTFEPLDDAEYTPAESGRISWIVKGVHGTPENPNKERIMRSPSVRIGDFYWNIKYYPRGNDGTEQVSVYIECSPTAYEEVEATAKVQTPSKPTDDADMSEVVQVSDGRPTAQASEGNGQTPLNTAPSSNESAEPLQSQHISPPRTTPEPNPTWRVAAQVSCVMYNPDEPRVYASQKSCHSYYNDNPDWGWTRFYGPWEDLHMRKKYQRQALLRNDTLAFTAYIRIVEDDTKALWWHPAKDKPQWNNVEMTGVRAFECHRNYQASNLVAAMSAWLHLKPFLQIIEEVPLLNPMTEPETRPRPILNELHDFVNEEGDYSLINRDLSVDMIAAFMDCGNSGEIKKMDVVALWENLRRRLNFEATNYESMQQANDVEQDLFKSMLLLKQPDPFGLDPVSQKFEIQPRDVSRSRHDHEPVSVQGAIDLASFYPEKAFRLWESHSYQPQNLQRCPEILQIELHRQHYDQESRKWKKLGHRIALDEQISFNQATYTLYGMIVHSGSLESQEYYSVLRPAGPNTRWIKYAGENSSRKVSVLTTKQAVTAHEGVGRPDLKVSSKPDKRKENAAVAYIAMYVRTDCLPGILATPFDREMLDARKAQASSVPVSIPEDDFSHIPVYFYGGDVFLSSTAGDIFDPWSRRVRKECQDVCKIVLPKTTKLCQVKGMLELELAEVSDQHQVPSLKIWLLNSSQLCISTFPTFLLFEKYADSSLASLGFSEGCRFWIACDKLADTRLLIQQLKSQDTSQLIKTLPEVPLAKLPEQSTPGGEELNGLVAPEPADVIVEETSRAEESPVVDNTDTVMSDAHDAQIETLPPPPPPVTDDAHQASEDTDDDDPRRTMCFVKIFDWETQELRSVTTFNASLSANVVKEVERAIGVNQRNQRPEESTNMEQDHKDSKANENFEVYHESPTLRLPHSHVGSHSTLEDFYPCFPSDSDIRCIFPGDGACFIAQRRPTAEQKNALEAAGKPTDVPTFMKYLKFSQNPTFTAPHRTSSYFGSSYFSGAQAYGRPHGQGTLITMTGDAYTGPFASGRKSGSGGKMIYANKDVYEGDWTDNEPHGKGVMTYEKTKNVYDGGWKKGKRHGEGTMHFKVADEQEKLCQ
ncbi:MAG: hypothetical protein Q9164_002817, partial [Protoblastenia rupestris]